MPKHIGFRCFLCAAIAIVCVLGARAAQAETLRFIAGINDGLTGKAPGYDIEVVRQVLAGMGRNVSFELFPTNRAWLMIARGERDGMTGVLRTSGRERYCSFSDEPLDRDRSVLFVRTAEAGMLEFSSLADLAGRSVAASVTPLAGLFEHAGLSPELAKFLLEHHTLVETNGDTESLRMLAAGRVDYAVMDLLERKPPHSVDRAIRKDRAAAIPQRNRARYWRLLHQGACFALLRWNLLARLEAIQADRCIPSDTAQISSARVTLLNPSPCQARWPC